jgi:hypothetical protein
VSDCDTALDLPFLVKSTYELDPVTNFPGPGALMTPVGLSPGGVSAIGAFKPVEQRSWPWECYSRVLEDRYRIELPANVAIGQIPKGVTYQSADVRYESTYEEKDHTLVVHRLLEVQRAGDVCAPQDNEAWKAFHTVLQRDLRSQIFYR